MNKIPDLVFHHHTSLGDNFICNGIVHTYSEQLCDRLHIPCHQRYYDTVNCLYQDFDNIIIHKFSNDWATLENSMFSWAKENEWPVTRIGFEKVYYRNMQRSNTPKECFAVNFDRQFYEQANVLFKDRYEKFVLPKNIDGCEELYEKLTQGCDDYIIVHNASSVEESYPIELWSWRNNYINKNIKIIEILEGQTTNMLQYMRLIENAKEIHCIPSSFFCLVDSVCTKIKADLYFHDVRMNNLMQVNCLATGGDRWAMIDYQQKI
jgi:hypothetical protein